MTADFFCRFDFPIEVAKDHRPSLTGRMELLLVLKDVPLPNGTTPAVLTGSPGNSHLRQFAGTLPARFLLGDKFAGKT